jgi:hypothetical protein
MARIKDVGTQVLSQVRGRPGRWLLCLLSAARSLGTPPPLTPWLALQRRPWAELLDRTAYARPENFAEVGLAVAHARLVRLPWALEVSLGPCGPRTLCRQASTRVRKNVHYFKVNYLIWLVTVAVVCMLANPRSLLVLFGASCRRLRLAVRHQPGEGASDPFVAAPQAWAPRGGTCLWCGETRPWSSPGAPCQSGRSWSGRPPSASPSSSSSPASAPSCSPRCASAWLASLCTVRRHRAHRDLSFAF